MPWSPGPDVSHLYDATDNPTGVTNADAVVEYAYDGLGRRVRVEGSDPKAWTVSSLCSRLRSRMDRESAGRETSRPVRAPSAPPRGVARGIPAFSRREGDPAGYP